jgi:2-polyprenyl-3-methyl-5-hydroxy-6-metoxy-1,4-benzoquinol methylase
MRTMVEKAYLSYYGTDGIIPVHQDTSDIDLHYARRRALYRHLGIPPLVMRNARILEFGPGTGDNALYLAACEPQLCVLVDGNPASVQAISDKLNRGLFGARRFECRMSDIREYTDLRRFDIVLCEGVIPSQEDPDAFLRHVASFAGADGIVVMTTMSAPSLLAEVCRRVIKAVLATRFDSQEMLLSELTSFFEPDLLSLPGMSRRHEDWVLDNILHPWPARITFTIPEAIDSLDSDFDFLGTSPSFVQDWRWYKAIPRNSKTWNDVAQAEYRRWEPFLIDYRLQPADCIPAVTAGLEAACEEALDIHHEIWHSNSVNDIPRFADCLLVIRAMIAGPAPETARAISDYMNGLEKLVEGHTGADFGSFRRWFGRGQQYLSFSRK